MGVDYSVTLGVGVSFRNQSEAKKFLQENLALSEEQHEEMEEDFGDFQYESIEVECMNQYSGDYWFVGVPFRQSGDPFGFLADVKSSIDAWKDTFPKVPAEIICEVAVW